MEIHVIKTHPIQVNESLFHILDQYISHLSENTVIAITSKVISLCEGRTIAKNEVSSKHELVKQEADAYLEGPPSPYGIYLTITNNILIPSSGIDESNGNGSYVLYPKDCDKTAEDIWHYLREKHQIQNIGIIITDSHTTPLRRGVTGIALSWCGFDPLYNYIGKPDVFGKLLQFTQINIPDALATAVVFMMGEGAEQTPISIIEHAPRVNFLPRPPTPQERNAMKIPLQEDVYAPILQKVNWVWNQNKQEGK